MTHWTDAQIEYALDNEGLVTHAELARRLGKTPKAVEAKIARVKGRARKQFERAQLDGSVSLETWPVKRRMTSRRVQASCGIDTQ